MLFTSMMEHGITICRLRKEQNENRTIIFYILKFINYKRKYIDDNY
jgi:hypothetical protein